MYLCRSDGKTNMVPKKLRYERSLCFKPISRNPPFSFQERQKNHLCVSLEFYRSHTTLNRRHSFAPIVLPPHIRVHVCLVKFSWIITLDLSSPSLLLPYSQLSWTYCCEKRRMMRGVLSPLEGRQCIVVTSFPVRAGIAIDAAIVLTFSSKFSCSVLGIPWNSRLSFLLCRSSSFSSPFMS